MVARAGISQIGGGTAVEVRFGIGKYALRRSRFEICGRRRSGGLLFWRRRAGSGRCRQCGRRRSFCGGSWRHNGFGRRNGRRFYDIEGCGRRGRDDVSGSDRRDEGRGCPGGCGIVGCRSDCRRGSGCSGNGRGSGFMGWDSDRSRRRFCSGIGGRSRDC